jgi:hypothetical protein
MIMKKLIATLALIGTAPLANSAILTLYLDSVSYTDFGGQTPTADISATTASYSFNTATQQFSSNGLTSIQYNVGPTVTLFKHEMTDFSIHSSTGVASASNFTCTEGTFGVSVGANICDSYNYGDNLIDEGGSGDDESFPVHDLTNYDMSSWYWDGSIFTLSTTMLIDGTGGPANTANVVMTFVASLETCDEYEYGCPSVNGVYASAVPVPAAAWLFGSALLSLAGIKRRK